MKKILLLLISFLVIFVVIFVKYDKYLFLYLSPNNNLKVNSYIANVAQKMNDIIENAVLQMNKEGYGAKVEFVSIIGSGFIKDNKTPSDCDFGAAVYLGEFEYETPNLLAKQLTKAILDWHYNLYLSSRKSKVRLYQKSPSSYKILKFNIDTFADLELLEYSLKNVLSGNNYKLKVNDILFDMSDDEAMFVTEQSMVVKFYTSDINYFDDYREFLRELTINLSYTAQIKDVTTGEAKLITIVSSMADRRSPEDIATWFVPKIYTSYKFFDYIKNYALIDDEEYIKARMRAFYSHNKYFDFINGIGEISPLKIVKRLNQCSDILEPVLDKNFVKDVRKVSAEILSNKTIIWLNDYYVANKNLFDILGATRFAHMMNENDEIAGLVYDMRKILQDVPDNISEDELKPIIEYQVLLDDNVADMENLTKLCEEKYGYIEAYLDRLMSAKIQGKEKLIFYNKYIEDVLKTAGFRQVRMYQQEPGLVYIFKDEFTKNLELDKLGKHQFENGYRTYIYDENSVFRLIDDKDFKGKYSKVVVCWTRDWATDEEDKIWHIMKEKFLRDRKHYGVKFNFGINKHEKQDN